MPSRKENRIIANNSKWATITIIVLSVLIAIWYLGSMPVWLVGILCGLNILIAIFDYQARNDLPKAHLSINVFISCALVIVAIIVLLCLYKNLNRVVYIISVIITGLLGYCGLTKNWRIIDRNRLQKYLAANNVIFVLTIFIGVCSALLGNDIKYKILGVFISSFISSYKNKVEDWYVKFIYDRFLK